MDVRANFVTLVKLWSNYSNLWPAGPVFMHFCAVLKYILQPTGKTNDDISGRFFGPVGLDNRVKYRYPRLNISREIDQESTGDAFRLSFFTITSDRKQFVTSYPVGL